jgi:DNA-binding transcriptional LysR family regulator
MEIRQLKYFLAVANHRHFTEAAQALHVSQPALSQQIRLLEEEIGVRLLERTNRSVELTPAGIAFRDRARVALHEADEAIAAARMVMLGEGGNLDIGYVTTATLVILPAILNAFSTRYPNVQVILYELSPGDQIAALLDNKISAAFTSFPSELPALECKLLVEEEMIVALPQNHAAAHQPAVDLASLSEERFLIPPREIQPGMHEMILGACQRSGFQPKQIESVKLAAAAVFLVAGKLGVAIIPESYRLFKVEGVVYKALRNTPLRFRMYAMRNREASSPIANNFWAGVEEYALKRKKLTA